MAKKRETRGLRLFRGHEPSPDHAEWLRKYEPMRAAHIELNSRIVKTIPKSTLEECARRLGLLKKGALVLGSEEELPVLMDYCLFYPTSMGRTLVSRYLEQMEPPTDPAVQAIADAMWRAYYTALLVQEVKPGVGLVVLDILRKETRFLVDVALGMSASPGAVLATRVLPTDSFLISGGAALPLDVEALKQTDLRLVEAGLGPKDVDYRQMTPKQEADLAAIMIRAALGTGMSSHIYYTTPQEAALEPHPRKTGVNAPCPCGSGEAFEACCGRDHERPAARGRPKAGSVSSEGKTGSRVPKAAVPTAKKQPAKPESKSDFLRRILARNPNLEFKDVNRRWTKAGRAGSISNTLYYLIRRELGIRTEWAWMPATPPASPRGTTAIAGPAYQLKITLLETEPPIWRRILVAECTLDELHEHIQNAMGWTNSHLHHFKIGKQLYGDPMLMEGTFEDLEYADSTTTRLGDIIPPGQKRSRFEYEYDFGDGWMHEILFEGRRELAEGERVPLCLEGQRACPPEDCGGVWGYADLVEAMADRKHERHAELREWLGRKFDPDAFSPTAATRRMRQGLPDWRSMR